MKFLFFTYFINPTKQGVLFPENKSKRSLLLDALKDTKLNSFKRGKSDLGFVYDFDQEGYVYCKFGKRSSIVKTLPPQEKFKEIKTENWPNCHMFINMSEDPKNGQRIAIEHKTWIFVNPLAQLRALADKINEVFLNNGFVLSINPITQESKFWEIIKQYRGQIEELKFTYDAPNLFNLQTSLNEDLKKARDIHNATETTMILKNKDGNLKIPDDNSLIKESVEYVGKGGGEYRIKAKTKIITSKDNVRSKSITAEIELETSNKDAIIKFAKEIFGDK